MARYHDNLLSTSNSRPWRSIGSFMYIGSAGPGPGGRAEGRADGRMGGRAGGRADGRTEGRTDGRTDGQAAGRTEGRNSTTMFIDFE